MYKIRRSNKNSNIVILDILGEYTMEDVIAANEEVALIAESSKIYLIIDTTDVKKFPRDLARLKKLSTPIGESTNIIGIAVVNKNSLLKFIANVIVALFEQSYALTKTLDEAEELALKQLT